MTVEKLIEELKKVDKDLQVAVWAGTNDMRMVEDLATKVYVTDYSSWQTGSFSVLMIEGQNVFHP